MAINQKILEYLRLHKEGASVSDISQETGHTRATSAKYLELMKTQDLVDYREVGKAKVWFYAGKEKKKILIVDDEPNILKLIKIILNPKNYDLFEAVDGKDALEKVNEHMPHLVILDLMMPKMDGFTACRRLKENTLTKKIQIIMLTAKRELDDKKKGISLGADDYLTKPFNPNELRARVNALLSQEGTDRDRVTNLPMLNNVEDVFSARKKEGFAVVSILLSNYVQYKKACGLSKAEEMLKILTQLINHAAENASNSAFLCYHKQSFVLFMEKEKVSHFKKAMEKSFKDALPFFYEKKVQQHNLSLDIKKHPLSKMRSFADLKKQF